MQVSVPIRGLFNLTTIKSYDDLVKAIESEVSVPIRGLFNLTIMSVDEMINALEKSGFRPHQGII